MKRAGRARSNGRRRKRAYSAFLGVGAVLAAALLVRQLFDYAADADIPALRQNDLYSAAGSVAMLAIIAYAFFGSARKAKL